MTMRNSLKFLVLFLASSICISSCIDTNRDVTPPFEASPALFKEGPIEAGNSFEIAMYFYTDYHLEKINVKVVIPHEVAVKDCPPEVLSKLPSDDRMIIRNLEWKGNMKPRSGNKEIFSLWLISNTKWTEWSSPIEIRINLYARSAKKTAPWPDGHYSKTITWSHEGYIDSGWEGSDKKIYR